MMNNARCKVGALALLGLSACATVTVRPGGGEKLSGQAQYENSESFFLWGLVGEHTVNVTQVCSNRKVTQMQAQFTAIDVILGTITLGIYAPRSAKVWCE